MTPQQLSDAFKLIESMGRYVWAIRISEAEFAPMLRNPDGTPSSHFDVYHTDQADPEEHVGRFWGRPVTYATMPMGQVVITGAGPDGRGYRDFVVFTIDLVPSVRLHVDAVDPEQQSALARRFNDRLRDMRDHVALDGHRSFALEPGCPNHKDEGYATSGGWTVSCFMAHGCRRQWYFTEDEIAAAGRFDLTSRHGWGAVIESVKLTPPRERPVAWGKVGLLEDDE